MRPTYAVMMSGSAVSTREKKLFSWGRGIWIVLPDAAVVHVGVEFVP